MENSWKNFQKKPLKENINKSILISYQEKYFLIIEFFKENNKTLPMILKHLLISRSSTVLDFNRARFKHKKAKFEII